MRFPYRVPRNIKRSYHGILCAVEVPPGKAGPKTGPSTPAPTPEPEEPWNKPWMILVASAVIALVMGVLAGTLAARATVKSIARTVVTAPGGGPTAPGAPPEDLSDVDIKLY